MTHYGLPRILALLFVIALPVIILIVMQILIRRGRSSAFQVSVSAENFWIFAAAQAVAIGFLLSFWLHFVPCFWLACDLSDDDDGTLRGTLWFGGWPFFTLFLLLPCLFDEWEYGFVRRATCAPQPETAVATAPPDRSKRPDPPILPLLLKV